MRISGALLSALLVGIAGLHVFLDGFDWWFPLAWLCVLLLGGAALVRVVFARRVPGRAGRAALGRAETVRAELPGRAGAGRVGIVRRLLPTVVSVIVLVATLSVVFAPSTAIFGVFPTGGSLDTVRQLVETANLSIARQTIPALVITPIMFLLCVGVGALAISADLFAHALRSPALAGIPLLVLVAVPSVVSIDSTDPIIFILAALCYLLLLRAASPSAARRQTGVAIGLSAMVLTGTLVAPLLLPAVIPAMNTNGTGVSSGVNPTLTLGQNLRQDSEHTVLTYSSDSGTSQYLRLVSLENFSGSQWAPESFSKRGGASASAIGSPPGLASDVLIREDQISVTVGGLTSPWLPLPYPTASVRGLSGDWSWDPDGLVVKSLNADASNQSYRATSLIIEPTPAQLANAGTTVPAGFQRFLALPSKMPKIIAQTANNVAGGAASNYERALLLQRFFRNGDFQYSETAPVDQGYDGTGMAVIAAFLREKKGYCIHFASAMAVMARSLGIPSRIAVGFLPGTKDSQAADGRSKFTVSSHDLHAWPELYFEGIGWTRFEPTVARGDVPAYADTASPDVPSPFNSATPVPQTSTVPRPRASARSVVTPQPKAVVGTLVKSVPEGSEAWLALAIFVAVTLLLVPAAWRSLLRSRRLRWRAGGGPSTGLAWEEVLDTAADLGVPVGATGVQTPREVAELLSFAVGATGSDPIDRVRAAVEQESYGQSLAGGGGRQVMTDTSLLAADAREIIAALRAGATRRRRLQAWLLAPSLVARIRRTVGDGRSVAADRSVGDRR